MDENDLNEQLPEEQLEDMILEVPEEETEPVLEEQLLDPQVSDEILPAEDAMNAAGLAHPSEAELTRIIADAKEQSGMNEQAPETVLPTEEFRDEAYREAFGEGEELAAMFREEPEQPEPEPQPEEEPPAEPENTESLAMRKGRPKRKKGYGLFGIPHILATVVWLAIIVMIGVSLGRVIWVCAADVLAFGRPDQEVQITIDNDDTLDDIALKLQEKGLIRYPELFKLYAVLTDGREDISTGTFTLNTIYDYHALVGAMNYYSSSREEVTVLIPEGFTCSQIFALLEEKGVCTAADLENYAIDGELDEYWFLEGVERGTKYCLEGYLFPDTYDFYVNDSPERVLEKMLDDFDYRFSEEMQASLVTLNETLSGMMRANGYGEDYIAQHQMTMREVVIVASLIEKETAAHDESPNIASVIYNRLTNQAAYPYLNIDAALLYAIGHRDAISNEDLQADTPYNTYTHAGLIPGPIANPGLSSLKAALNPAATDYHYYALNNETGMHKFSKTLDEHNAFLANQG